jgi:hypothetical protein
MVGGLTLSSSLTTWQDVHSIGTAFKLVVAALKICQEAWQMCAAGMLGFISDVYLSNTLEHLKNCWVGAGGVCGYLLQISHVLMFSPFLDHCFLTQCPIPSYHSYYPL